MKTIKRMCLLLVGICFFAPAPLLAGSSQGPVTLLQAHEGDVAMFSAGAHSGAPACSSAGEEWAFSLTSHYGRAMYALLISAQAQGKEVLVTGSNVCSAWGDRETAKRIRVVD